MSTFSDSWAQCMRGNGFPVPDVEGANEALEFLDKLHSAWENSGGETAFTIGSLIALGAAVGVDEAALAVLGEIAEVAVAVYISACIACLGSVAYNDLISLNASNELPDFVVAELSGQGVDLTGQAIA